MITLDLPETLEKHFWNIVRDSYHGDLQAAVTAFLKLHEKYEWKEQLVKDIKSVREEVHRTGGMKLTFAYLCHRLSKSALSR